MKTIFWAIIICKMHFILGCVNDTISIAKMISDDFRDFQRTGRRVGGRDGRKLISFITKNDNIEVMPSILKCLKGTVCLRGLPMWWNNYELAFSSRAVSVSLTRLLQQLFRHLHVCERVCDGVITNVRLLIDIRRYFNFTTQRLNENEIQRFHCGCCAFAVKWINDEMIAFRKQTVPWSNSLWKHTQTLNARRVVRHDFCCHVVTNSGYFMK